jgi:hypothetical protein
MQNPYDPANREPDYEARRLASDYAPVYGVTFDQLHRMLSADAEPALDMEDLHTLLRLHRIIDANGYAPTHERWTPTFDLYAAVAEGWRWKAAKAAERFSFSADGASYNRDQIYTHCMEQAKRYSARIIRTHDVTPYGKYYDQGMLP